MPDATTAYAAFPDLTFDRPADHVLRITLDGPGLNATGPAMHRQLADVWLDRRPRSRHVRRRAAGRRQGVLGRRQLRADRRHRQRLRPPPAGHARGARPRVQRHQLLEADRVGDARRGRRRRPRRRAARRRLGRVAHGEDHRRPHPPRRRRRRPRGDLLAAAVRHGEGEVLPADVRPAERRGGRAHRARVAVRRRRRGARPGAGRSPCSSPAGRRRRSASRSRR